MVKKCKERTVMQFSGIDCSRKEMGAQFKCLAKQAKEVCSITVDEIRVTGLTVNVGNQNVSIKPVSINRIECDITSVGTSRVLSCPGSAYW